MIANQLCYGRKLPIRRDDLENEFILDGYLVLCLDMDLNCLMTTSARNLSIASFFKEITWSLRIGKPVAVELVNCFEVIAPGVHVSIDAYMYSY